MKDQCATVRRVRLVFIKIQVVQPQWLTMIDSDIIIWLNVVRPVLWKIEDEKKLWYCLFSGTLLCEIFGK